MKNSLPLYLLVLVLSACSPSKEQVELRKANKEASKKNYLKAINKYFLVYKKYSGTEESVGAVREAAKHSLLNQRDYASAIYFFKKLMILTEDGAEKIFAQKKIAEIQFLHLKDCGEAIREYKKLLTAELNSHDKFVSIKNIANCYGQLGDFKQAFIELKAIDEASLSKKDRYSFYLDTAHNLENTNNLEQAHKIYKKINQLYPVLYQKESLGLKVAVLFEEEKKFSKAIETLRKVRPSYPQPDFIDIKIESLKRRRRFLPEG